MNEAETRATAFDASNLQALRCCLAKGEQVEWKAAKCPKSFAGHIGANDVEAHLVAGSETRDRLLNAATDNVEALAWRILAWGGMRVNNGEALQGCGADWTELCREIVAGKHSRCCAYDAFARLRREGKTKGLGPAYFTKLIYFLMPRTQDRPVGYIMDQWVSCAVNLLATEPVVRAGANFVVSDRNTGEIYERYCRTIESLAESCSLSPEALEIQLMSQGGRRPASWRAYVLKHRKPNP